MDKNIFLSRRILEDTRLDEKAIGVYMAIRSLYNNISNNLMCVTINGLCYELLGHLNASRNFKESMNVGLNTLIQKGYILLSEKKAKEYVIDVSELYIKSVKNASQKKDKDYYITLQSQEIHKIFNSEKRTDKFALGRLFAIMLASIDYNATILDENDRLTPKYNFVGYMPQEFLSKLAQISTGSCSSYIKDLEELKLIYVYRHNAHVSKDGKIEQLNNNYGRFCDAELIIAYSKNIREYKWEEEYTERQKRANYGRSMTQKYYCMCNGKVYDEQTIQEIYSYIHSKNVAIQSMIESCKVEEYKQKLLSQLKDETIFKDIKVLEFPTEIEVWGEAI